MKRHGSVPFALFASLALAWALPAFATQPPNCANGKTLFHKLDPSLLSCSNSACHGNTATAHNIQNAANNPGLIDQALDGLPGDPAMYGLRASLNLTYSDLEDIADYIFYASTSCPASAPSLLAAPAPVAFPSTTVGSTSAPIAVTVTNAGSASATAIGFSNGNGTEFIVSGNTCTGATVAVGTTCAFSVAFKPSASGSRSGTLTLTYNSKTLLISTSGTGSSGASPGQLSMSASIGFGNQTVGTTSSPSNVTVTNIGGTAVAVSSVGSSNPSEFAITSSTCAMVNAGAGCAFSVAFTPGATGTRTATVTLVSNGTGSPQSVNASGTGVTGAGMPGTIDLIEYHHAAWDHYFITGIADEITKLDNGTFVGWARTGLQFKAFPTGTANGSAVCRFFSTAFAPRSSHFYTPFASECATVMTNPDWQFEAQVFNIPIPATDGSCATGTVPVYRLYNNGQGAAPNHRYTTDLSVRSQMMAQGWVPEGYGSIGVIMCAPQ
jgi:hypothetical protein